MSVIYHCNIRFGFIVCNNKVTNTYSFQVIIEVYLSGSWSTIVTFTERWIGAFPGYCVWNSIWLIEWSKSTPISYNFDPISVGTWFIIRSPFPKVCLKIYIPSAFTIYKIIYSLTWNTSYELSPQENDALPKSIANHLHGICRKEVIERELNYPLRIFFL